MNPRVKSVKPNADFTLNLIFENGETKSFDVKPYLNIGIFQELKNIQLFNSVKPFLGSIQWKNGQDFCPDTLYLDSISVSVIKRNNIKKKLYSRNKQCNRYKTIAK